MNPEDRITPQTWQHMSPEVAAQTIRGLSDDLKEAMNEADHAIVERFLQALATIVDDGKIRVPSAHQIWCRFIECFMVDPDDLEDLERCQMLAGLCCYEAGISVDWVNDGVGPITGPVKHSPIIFPGPQDL